MNESTVRRKARPIEHIAFALLPASLAMATAAAAVEPEKQPFYSNVPGGLMCGTSSDNACKVPAGQRLIIEYVSGYVFLPPSASQFTSVNIVIKDPQLGLNGAAFHIFPAIKVNTTASNDVFAFSAPLKLMLHPNAIYYFQPATSVSVSGYLVSGS